MIPESAIIEWRETAPWVDDAQVEQDLIICRAMIAIYQDEFLSQRLVMRGGTALNKLYLHPQPRYSEDIDLVQIQPEGVGAILDRLRETLSFLGKPVIKQKNRNNTLIFKVESSTPPVVPIKLKIEINCREHFHVYDFEKRQFGVSNQWFSGECDIMTYRLDELVGTKVRALYERRKGRDLFDLYRALQDERLNAENVMTCFFQYMENEGKTPSHTLYTENMDEKLTKAEFHGDTNNLLRPGTVYNPVESYAVVKEKLIDKLKWMKSLNNNYTKNPEGFNQSQSVALEGAKVAKEARENIERRTGKSAISPLNAKELPDRTDDEQLDAMARRRPRLI